MDQNNAKQEREQVYGVIKHLGRCQFTELSSICQLSNQSVYRALLFLCRHDKIRQEWNEDGIWYCIAKS